MRNAMRTLLALFVLTAVTAALLLQLQIRHPLQATQGSDPETASFLSLRSARNFDRSAVEGKKEFRYEIVEVSCCRLCRRHGSLPL